MDKRKHKLMARATPVGAPELGVVFAAPVPMEQFTDGHRFHWPDTRRALWAVDYASSGEVFSRVDPQRPSKTPKALLETFGGLPITCQARSKTARWGSNGLPKRCNGFRGLPTETIRHRERRGASRRSPPNSCIP